jgi:hypothetical protein
LGCFGLNAGQAIDPNTEGLDLHKNRALAGIDPNNVPVTQMTYLALRAVSVSNCAPSRRAKSRRGVQIRYFRVYHRNRISDTRDKQQRTHKA